MLTGKLRGSLHVYLEQIAQDFNDAGYDLKEIVTLPIRFTKDNVKENLFKVYMNKMYPDIESTEDLTPTQLQHVYEAFNAAISQRFGVGRDWPHEDMGTPERKVYR